MSLSPSSNPDWLVLQCRKCSTRMKVRRDLGPGFELLCPHCRAPVALQGEGPHGEKLPEGPPGVESRPESPPERAPEGEITSPGKGPEGRAFGTVRQPSGVFQGGIMASGAPVPPRDAGAPADPQTPLEFAAIIPADWSESGETAKGKRHGRTKKWRNLPPDPKHMELLDWNHTGPEGIPAAELVADVWGDPKSLPGHAGHSWDNEYVIRSEQNEDGKTRLTKRKLRRRLVGVQRGFFRLTRLSRYFMLGLGLLLAGVTIYGFLVFTKKYSVSSGVPIPELPVDRWVLTHEDEIGAEKAVRAFLLADGVDAKLPFVRRPAVVGPLMKKWYQNPNHPSGPQQAGNIAGQDKVGGEGGDMNGYFVLLALPVQVPDPLNPLSTLDQMTYFSVEEIREGSTNRYLVDWETSTGYQEMPLETFKATLPPESHEFRVYLKSDTYYNHGFEKSGWQCVKLYYPGRDFQLWGYIERRPPAGWELIKRLEKGWSGGIIAELHYPQNPISPDQVIIRRMVHDSWYYKNTEETVK